MVVVDPDSSSKRDAGQTLWRVQMPSVESVRMAEWRGSVFDKARRRNIGGARGVAFTVGGTDCSLFGFSALYVDLLLNQSIAAEVVRRVVVRLVMMFTDNMYNKPSILHRQSSLPSNYPIDPPLRTCLETNICSKLNKNEENTTKLGIRPTMTPYNRNSFFFSDS